MLKGSSLADLGVRDAVLLAAVPNDNAEWTRLGSPDLSAYVRGLPGVPTPEGQAPFEYGPFVWLSPEAALLGGGFTTLEGDAVHSTFITEPERVVEALKSAPSAFLSGNAPAAGETAV